ncbi:hypothetical protein [Hyphococcus luteus]|uniref:hypothetical protein n=1 Tax=Hyphococcus luteus TaxID=2058213 RepID=UPI0010571AAF|nr:hypothetical protein [Marinicaulis flavus]
MAEFLFIQKVGLKIRQKIIGDLRLRDSENKKAPESEEDFSAANLRTGRRLTPVRRTVNPPPAPQSITPADLAPAMWKLPPNQLSIETNLMIT